MTANELYLKLCKCKRKGAGCNLRYDYMDYLICLVCSHKWTPKTEKGRASKKCPACLGPCSKGATSK
jgi:hypothetical protein